MKESYVNNKKSICIIAFSEIARDARVLRQIKYLSPAYKLTVIGLGEADPAWDDIPDFEWKSMAPGVNYPFFKKALVAGLMFLAKVIPVLYAGLFWLIQGYYSKALRIASEKKYDIIYANDWNTLPIAVNAAKNNNAKILFDAHEYGPLQNNDILYKFLIAPEIRYILKKNLPFINVSITVSSALSEKYRDEFDIDPMVVMNAPEWSQFTDHEIVPEHIRLVHHGRAAPARNLENMIYAIALTDKKYSLHFMLVGDPKYISQLKQLADEIAPQRVFFETPVSPEEVPESLSKFDMGFYLLEPFIFNAAGALPNKFFDFVIAGLAVCIGPSPEMSKMVRKYNCGCIAKTFEPKDVADMLNRLTPEQIEEMRNASHKMAKEVNAKNEMKKLINLIENLT